MQDIRTKLEIALDDVKMDKTDQMNFLQDRGYVSDNCIKIEEAWPDLQRLSQTEEDRIKICREFEDYLGQWSFLW